MIQMSDREWEEYHPDHGDDTAIVWLYNRWVVLASEGPYKDNQSDLPTWWWVCP